MQACHYVQNSSSLSISADFIANDNFLAIDYPWLVMQHVFACPDHRALFVPAGRPVCPQ